MSDPRFAHELDAARLDALGPAGVALARLPARRRAEAIALTATRLLDPGNADGRSLRGKLVARSGLSPAGVAYALESSLAVLTSEAMLALVERVGRANPGVTLPVGRVHVVLSANVCTAPLRALAIPLLLGNAVLAKASPRDDVVAHAFAAALAEVDPEVASALVVDTFTRADEDREAAHLSRADAVVVYGNDATLAVLRARTPVGVPFVAHGHGLGIGFVPGATLLDDEARLDAARAFARDVAAYDQQGCLSPHAIVVEGSPDDAALFASELSTHGLTPLDATLPRGALPATAAGAMLTYRALGLAHGDLYESTSHVVTAEGEATLRPSMGSRTVQVVSSGGRRALFGRLALLGRHLKVLGVAGNESLRRELAHALPRGVSARVVEAGTMQTPPLDVPWDGAPPELGLVRVVGC